MGISALASFRIHAASYGSTIPQSFLSSVLAETQVKCTYGIDNEVIQYKLLWKFVVFYQIRNAVWKKPSDNTTSSHLSSRGCVAEDIVTEASSLYERISHLKAVIFKNV